MDDKNPVINHLLRLYSNVILNINPLEYDIAKLVYCYNLVGSLILFKKKYLIKKKENFINNYKKSYISAC